VSAKPVRTGRQAGSGAALPGSAVPGAAASGVSPHAYAYALAGSQSAAGAGDAVAGGMLRLYAVEFDSLTQRRLRDRGRTAFGPDAASSFVAMMRLSDLLSGSIVITDNMVFDGIMFHQIGPRRLLELIGRPVGAALAFPFEVRSRARNLEQALLRSLRDPRAAPRDRLYTFEFAALDVPEEERIRIGQRLGRLRVRELDRRVRKFGVAGGLARLLVDRCDAPEDKVRHMQQQWAAWIEADRRGLLDFRRAGERRDIDDDRAFARDPVETMRADLRTEDGRQALHWVYENRHQRRTDVRAWLRERLPDDDARLAADREVIELWHNACYLRSLALAQGAELIEFLLGDPKEATRRRLLRRRGSAHSDGETRRVRLPATLMAELGQMPRAVFATVRYANREALQSWRRHGDRGSMRRLAYGLLAATEQPDPRRLSRETELRLLLVIIAAFVAEAEAFDSVSWWIKGPVLLATVLASSWQDVQTFFQLRGRLGAVIDVHDD
jgi:hypothetical protein